MIGDLVIVVGLVIVAGVAGVALGMLIAPRIGRLVERGADAPTPEETGDDHPS